MTEKKLPTIAKGTSVASALERSNQLMRVTQNVLQRAKSAKELAISEDESWVERLCNWANDNNIPELKWIEESRKIYFSIDGWVLSDLAVKVSNDYCKFIFSQIYKYVGNLELERDAGLIYTSTIYSIEVSGFWIGLPRNKTGLESLSQLNLINYSEDFNDGYSELDLDVLFSEISHLKNLTHLSCNGYYSNLGDLASLDKLIYLDLSHSNLEYFYIRERREFLSNLPGSLEYNPFLIPSSDLFHEFYGFRNSHGTEGIDSVLVYDISTHFKNTKAILLSHLHHSIQGYFIDYLPSEIYEKISSYLPDENTMNDLMIDESIDPLEIFKNLPKDLKEEVTGHLPIDFSMEKIWGLRNVEILEITEADLEILATKIKPWKNLKHLKIKDIVNLKDFKIHLLSDFKSLQRLDIPLHHLEVFPVQLYQLSKLHTLIIKTEGKHLNFPDGIEQLSNLEYLEIHGESITIPDEIELMPNLRTLKISGKHITFSDGFGLTPSIENIELFGKALESISLPKCVESWFNLSQLKIASDSLSLLPQGIECFPNLEKLHLEIGISNINNFHFEHFPSLEVLIINNKYPKAMKLDAGSNIWSLHNLKELHICHNELYNLPAEIGNLSRLEVLNISHNELYTLPPEIGKLSRLKNLNISHNRILELPKEMNNLKNLIKISASENFTYSDDYYNGFRNFKYLVIDDELLNRSDLVIEETIQGPKYISI